MSHFYWIRAIHFNNNNDIDIYIEQKDGEPLEERTLINGKWQYK